MDPPKSPQAFEGVPTSELSADFTALDNQREVCERPACKKILPAGVKREYLNGNNGGGRLVCLECADYYRGKATTRRVNNPGISVPNSELLPAARIEEREGIHKENARAQRGEPGKEIRVGALPVGQNTQGSTGAVFAIPSVPAQDCSGYITSATRPVLVQPPFYGFHPTRTAQHQLTPSLLRVGIPGISDTPTPAPPASMQVSALNGQGSGYTASHLSYSSHRSYMAGKAYASDIETKGLIEAWFVELPGGKKNWKPIGDCMEVFSVPVNIGVTALKSRAFSTLLPLWSRWAGGFSLSIEQVTMRNKNWAHFEVINPRDTDVIRSEYFAPAKKAGAPAIFKKDHKVTVLLHVPNKIVSDATFSKKLHDEAGMEDDPVTPTKVEAHDQCAEPTTPPQRPQKKAKTKMESPYHSPDRANLVAALRAERISISKSIPILLESSIPVRIFYAKEFHLNDLMSLASAAPSWLNYFTEGLAATLYADLSPSKALKGEFKLTSLGSCSPRIFDTSDIAVKQFYFKKSAIKSKLAASDDNPGGQSERETIVTTHYYAQDPEKQHPALVMEIKLLQWGQALLKMVYAYIDSRNPGDKVQNFIDIPQFRFVCAALAVEQIPSSSSQARPRVFLLEEDLSKLGSGHFRKYMSNMPYIFLPSSSKEDEVRAEFLRFTQHVMYWKTKGLAYVSDYQGTESTLTDCQLMTHRSLGPIFADGNVPEGFEGLVDHHDCRNRFCAFFDLPKLDEMK